MWSWEVWVKHCNKIEHKMAETKCKKITSKKYQTRKSPPYHANMCPNVIKKGNDNNEWISVANKRGVYTWKRTTQKTSQATLFVLYTLNESESWEYGTLPKDWWWVGAGSADGTGFEQEEQFTGPPSLRTHMKEFLNTYFTDLKDRGIITKFVIRSKYPTPL